MTLTYRKDKFDFIGKMWYHLSKMRILEKHAGKRRTFHPERPFDSGDHLVRRCSLFYLRRDADFTAKLTATKSVSDPQPFSDVGTVDDSRFADDRRDGVFYRRIEQRLFYRK